MAKRVVVITCWGSHGDLFPYIGLALALKARGHRPVIATSPGYRENIEREGIEFAVAGPTVDGTDVDLFKRVMDPMKGSEVIVRELLMTKLRPTYEELRHAVAGADLLVTHPITFAGPVVAEHARLPWLSTVLAPLSFFSAGDPAVLPTAPRLNDLPFVGPWLAHTILRLARPTLRRWVEPVAQLRAELGLPPGGHPMLEGQYSPHGTLALFSRVLAEPQPDWPPNAVVTGSVFYNEADPLEPRLEEFLAAGRAARRVHARHLGRRRGRAVLPRERGRRGQARRTRRAVDRRLRAEPARRPCRANVLLVDRAPHQLLFPRASAVVHQCGAGTTAQALRSGRPTLLVPHGHDQFDNARRISKLGVARTVFPAEYRAERVARDLGALLRDASYRERAAAIAAIVREERGAEAAADAIERALA